jgi:nucleotide-binding universal stress UspA family protein
MFKSVVAGVDGGEGDADVMALARLLADPDARVTPTTIPAALDPAHGLHHAAARLGADLIVVASSRRGLLGRILAGDDVTATLRSAPCAVAVAPRGLAAANPPAFERIGVGYDGGPNAQAALDVARAVAARDGAEIRALGVATPPQGLVTPVSISAVAALEAKRDQIERCIARLEPCIVGRVADGIAHQELAELSTEVDLLVVGTSRRGAVGRVLLGSTSEQLSREASCPLLVVPARAE